MTKRYRLLRSLLRGADIDQKYLGELMNRSSMYLTPRFNGRLPWSQDDQYFLMDLLKFPYGRMHELFPKDGVNECEDNIPLADSGGADLLVAVANALLTACGRKEAPR